MQTCSSTIITNNSYEQDLKLARFEHRNNVDGDADSTDYNNVYGDANSIDYNTVDDDANSIDHENECGQENVCTHKHVCGRKNFTDFNNSTKSWKQVNEKSREVTPSLRTVAGFKSTTITFFPEPPKLVVDSKKNGASERVIRMVRGQAPLEDIRVSRPAARRPHTICINISRNY